MPKVSQFKNALQDLSGSLEATSQERKMWKDALAIINEFLSDDDEITEIIAKNPEQSLQEGVQTLIFLAQTKDLNDREINEFDLNDAHNARTVSVIGDVRALQSTVDTKPEQIDQVFANHITQLKQFSNKLPENLESSAARLISAIEKRNGEYKKTRNAKLLTSNIGDMEMLGELMAKHFESKFFGGEKRFEMVKGEFGKGAFAEIEDKGIAQYIDDVDFDTDKGEIKRLENVLGKQTKPEDIKKTLRELSVAVSKSIFLTELTNSEVNNLYLDSAQKSKLAFKNDDEKKLFDERCSEASKSLQQTAAQIENVIDGKVDKVEDLKKAAQDLCAIAKKQCNAMAGVLSGLGAGDQKATLGNAKLRLNEAGEEAKNVSKYTASHLVLKKTPGFFTTVANFFKPKRSTAITTDWIKVTPAIIKKTLAELSGMKSLSAEERAMWSKVKQAVSKSFTDNPLDSGRNLLTMTADEKFANDKPAIAAVAAVLQILYAEKSSPDTAQWLRKTHHSEIAETGTGDKKRKFTAVINDAKEESITPEKQETNDKVITDQINQVKEAAKLVGMPMKEVTEIMRGIEFQFENYKNTRDENRKDAVEAISIVTESLANLGDSVKFYSKIDLPQFADKKTQNISDYNKSLKAARDVLTTKASKAPEKVEPAKKPLFSVRFPSKAGLPKGQSTATGATR